MNGTVRIAFVQSCWHREIVDQCRHAFENICGSFTSI